MKEIIIKQLSQFQRFHTILQTVVSLAAFATIIAVLIETPPSTVEWLQTAGLGALYGLTWYFGVEFEAPKKQSPMIISASDAPLLFSLCILGVTAIPALLVGEAVARWVQRRWRQPLGYLFNFQLLVKSAIVVFALIQLTTSGNIHSLGVFPQGTIATCIIVGGYFLMSTLDYALLNAVGARKSVLHILGAQLRPTLWITMIPSMLGVVLAAVLVTEPGLVLPLVVPVMLTYFALRAVAEWLSMHTALQRSAEELEQRVVERTTELATSNALLAQTEQLLRSTTRAVAHDVSATVRNCVALLEDTPAQDIQRSESGSKFWRQGFHPPRARWQSALSSELQFIQDLIDDLLLSAQLREGKLTLTRAPVDLTTLLAQLAGRYQLLASRQHTTITVDFDETPALSLNSRLIERAVANILDNALKYTRGCPIRSIHFSSLTRDDAVTITVADTGVGIASESLNELGTAFYRAAQGARYEGVGLGLHGVQQIVWRHGGQLQVSSPGLGLGTTVVITLPLEVEPSIASSTKLILTDGNDVQL